MSLRSSLVALLLLGALPLPALAQSAYPDGYVIWASNRQASRVEAYIARADGSDVKRLTFGGASLPAWAPDGRWISYMDPSSTIYVMRPDGSQSKVLAAGWQIMWMHDNSGLLVQEGNDFNVYDPETGTSTFIFSRNAYPQFDGTTFQVNAMTHDNRYVLLGSHLFINGYTASNGSFTSEYSAVVLDLLDPSKVFYFGSGCWPFTPPQGDLIFHICANCPTHPDIYHMHLADLMTRASYAAEVAHDDPDWGHEYNPRVSNDNRWLAYMASAGCHQGDGCDYDIWLHQLGTPPSQRLRVTQDPSFDGYPQLYVGPLWQATDQPRLLVTPNRVTFRASATKLPAAQVLKLKNTGGGTLSAATVTTNPAPSWLDVTQSASTITVSLRAGANIVRGTQCVNVTIDVPGALGSPVTVPVTLIADDSFPYPTAVSDGGAGEVGFSSEAGALTDAAVCEDASVAGPDDATQRDPSTVVTVDGGGFECDSAQASDVDAGTAPLDASTTTAKTSDGGCSCSVGSAVGPTPLAAFALLGLAILVVRRRRR